MTDDASARHHARADDDDHRAELVVQARRFLATTHAEQVLEAERPVDGDRQRGDALRLDEVVDKPEERLGAADGERRDTSFGVRDDVGERHAIAATRSLCVPRCARFTSRNPTI